MDIMMDTIDRQYRLIGVLKAEVERLQDELRSVNGKRSTFDQVLRNTLSPREGQTIIGRVDELMAEVGRLKAESADRRIVLDLSSTEAERELRAEVERLEAAPPRPAAVVFECEDREFAGTVTSVMSTVAHAFERMEDVNPISPWIFRVDSWTWHPAKPIGAPSPPPWERRDFRGVPTPAEDPDPPIDWSEPGDGMPIGDACK